MAYNKYNTRHSGRFNTPGQFVPAGELAGGAAPGGGAQRQQHNNPNLAVGQPFNNQPFTPAPQPPLPRNVQQNLQTVPIQIQQQPPLPVGIPPAVTRPFNNQFTPAPQPPLPRNVQQNVPIQIQQQPPLPVGIPPAVTRPFNNQFTPAPQPPLPRNVQQNVPIQIQQQPPLPVGIPPAVTRPFNNQFTPAPQPPLPRNVQQNVPIQIQQQPPLPVGIPPAVTRPFNNQFTPAPQPPLPRNVQQNVPIQIQQQPPLPVGIPPAVTHPFNNQFTPAPQPPLPRNVQQNVPIQIQQQPPLPVGIPPAVTRPFNNQFTPAPQPPLPRNVQQNVPIQIQQQPPLPSADVEMKTEPGTEENAEGGTGGRVPHWMKNKLLGGVKKISNKERRRRQNESLRRLLTPKNALMVLNEMMPNEQLATQFKVEPAGNQFYKPANQQSFCADLTLDGNIYKGYGENKLSARNAAAEKAIRDLIIKRMSKVFANDAATASTNAENGAGAEGEAATVETEESLPMIQLASFALHKLFSEWEYEGVKVPQLKPQGQQTNTSTCLETLETVTPAPPKPKPPMKRKELPPNAATLHPCMLLTYMRPGLEYRELAVTGDKPQTMLFTMGVDVDGATYIGKASNKKEARRAAARAACAALFNVSFPEPAAPLVQQQ